ncbi:MAG: DUF3088 family protein [Cellvibrionales bacterium]
MPATATFPHCLGVVGLMALFPKIRHPLEVHYVDFAKPHGQLAEWVGTYQQHCTQLFFVGGDDFFWRLTTVSCQREACISRAPRKFLLI